MFHDHLDFFLNNLFEVGLTRNLETMALQMFTTIENFEN